MVFVIGLRISDDKMEVRRTKFCGFFAYFLRTQTNFLGEGLLQALLVFIDFFKSQRLGIKFRPSSFVKFHYFLKAPCHLEKLSRRGTLRGAARFSWPVPC